ncbi:hypothetical protein cand_009230 [Cryptosporidium andersoni]|uniref:Uncharacterized protein n=1 Tax=Cryptosporidium andersoni TaxID=117008 RepID=A0A1J4MTC0_9CRYT|nr:hypothetical protein cand_009230 [Cryptosporidium andersoni]
MKDLISDFTSKGNICNVNTSLSELWKSLDNLITYNPELYISLVKQQLSDKFTEKVVIANSGFATESGIYYSEVSTQGRCTNFKSRKLGKVIISVGYTDDMLLPQVQEKSGNYRDILNMEELNIAQLTTSFADLPNNINTNTLHVEVVLHTMVIERAVQDELFKRYMISIIHDRLLMKLRSQDGKKGYLYYILIQGKNQGYIPKSGRIEDLSFYYDEIKVSNIKDERSWDHLLSFTCYKNFTVESDTVSNEEIESIKNLIISKSVENTERSTTRRSVYKPTKLSTVNSSLNKNLVEEIDVSNEAGKLPHVWTIISDKNGANISSCYKPIYCKASFRENNISAHLSKHHNNDQPIVEIMLKSSEILVQNLDKMSAQVSSQILRLSYDSNLICSIQLNQLISSFHACPICKPSFIIDNCVVFCNSKHIWIALPIYNTCSKLVLL